MYQAKTWGKARYAIFDAGMTQDVVERLELQTDLRLALDLGQFELHYQPIYSLRDGGIREVEALLRWNRPGRGLVPPAEFIPLAEETGLIVPIGQWVLQEACRQVREWHAQRPYERIVVSVNLSARQFLHPSLVSDIEGTLRTVGLEARYLKLEITESTAMQDAETTVAKLRALKDLGIQLAIDDFGTGYSSLAYLKRFPVDTLKIDRSFVDGVGHDMQDTAIVQCVVALAKSLQLSVTGEGIESRDQAHHLGALGCDRGQGYLFARPMPAHALAEIFEEPEQLAA
jgi:EAL domain-containing protein (putative c-di-GMP-specific phosphodiesterase class I)